MTKRRVVLAAASLFFCISGCYEQVIKGDEITYQFAWWVPPVIILVCLLALPVGWFFRKSKVGFVLLFMSPILLFVLVPAVCRDRVQIDDDHFEATYGFWFDPALHNLRFEDLSEIQYIAISGRRGSKSYELHCQTKTGSVTVVHAGTLVGITVPEILKRATAKGVRVVNKVN